MSQFSKLQDPHSASMRATIESPFMARTQAAQRLDYYKQSNCAEHATGRYAQTVNPDGSKTLIYLPCKKWSCTHCAYEVLYPRLSVALYHAIREHDLNQWITLTIPHDKQRPDPARYSRKVSKVWTAIRNAYAKKFKTPLVYFWVREIKDGWPHLHVITKDINKKWLKKQWHKRTGGQQVHIQPITGAAPRLVDYALKDIHNGAAQYGNSCGRWWGASRDLGIHLHPKPVEDDGRVWQCVQGTLADIVGDNHQVIRTDRVGRPTEILINERRSA